MTMYHTISPETHLIEETLCGIEFHPLRFISYITFDKLNTVENPCPDCVKKLNELYEKVKIKDLVNQYDICNPQTKEGNNENDN